MTAPICTARLRIEAFTESFITPRYIGWLNDPEVVRYSDQRLHTHTEASCREYLVGLAQAGGRMWGVIEVEVGIGHIGNLNAYIDQRHGVVDVGVMIGERAVWGRGLASEALTGVVDDLFRYQGMRKVTMGTIATNQGMLGVMRKLGMRPDGRRMRHHVWNGEAVDVIHMALFAEDWLQVKQPTQFG